MTPKKVREFFTRLAAANPEPTFAGAARLSEVPSPTWPAALSPQAQSVPSSLTPSEWFAPAATPANPDPICAGASRSAVVPSPTWPLALPPHAQSVPSSRIR